MQKHLLPVIAGTRPVDAPNYVSCIPFVKQFVGWRLPGARKMDAGRQKKEVMLVYDVNDSRRIVAD